MKGYLNRVIPIMILLIVFVMAIYTDVPNKLEKNIRTLTNQNKLSDSCETGEGTTYYVTANALNVRTGPGTTYSSITSLNRCTVVKVYCTSGSWGKISKTSEKWISSDYITTTRPSECTSTYITTTDTISFDSAGITETPAAGYDKMYADRNGTITIKVKNIKNVALDDASLFNIKISNSGSDVTDKFDITKSLNGSNMTITIKMNGAVDSDKYSPGIYSVNVSAGEDNFSDSFTLVGKYYNFTASYEKVSGPTGNPSNKKNTWKVTFDNLVAIDPSKFSYVITKDGEKFTSKFNVSRNNAVFSISNKTSWSTRPQPGTYKVTFTYSNSNYSNARGDLTYSFDLVIGSRDITFERESIKSYRYIRTKDNVPYSIELISKTTSNNISYIKFIENGVINTMTQTEFQTIYTDLDIAHLNLTSTGRIAYRYNELCTITNYLNGIIAYMDDTGTTYTTTEDSFASLFEEAYTNLLSGTYTFDESGNLQLKAEGTKVVDGKRLSPKNQNIFSLVGGEFSITYRYADLDEEDFSDATYKIYREDGSIVDTSDGFSFSWSHDSNYVYVKIIYDNQDEKYTGNYYVRVWFKNAGYKDIPFVLYDGEIDFYLTSQVDGHLTSNNPLGTTYPPGNQKYEYYLGFYLVKGGQVQTTKNAQMIEVNIYDHYADLDEDGNIYFYDQVDYEVRIQKFINNNVTYQVSLNGGESVTKTSTFEEFNQLYEDAAELIDMYNYDESGNITSDKYELHITKFYYDASIADMRVEYSDALGVVHNDTLNNFKVAYPDMYGYLVTRFVFDISGNIVMGALNGTYRVTEYNGLAIEGKEVTSQFDIEIDNSSTNIEKAVKILPKTEVDAGTYYVYVSYDTKLGVGFINNDEDAVITKEQYPEMWEQNIHMTMINYIDPIYSLSIDEPIISNVGNTSKKIYNNIEGTAYFSLKPKDIYDYSGITYNIEYYDGSNWIDANNHYSVKNSLDISSGLYDTKNPYIELTTNIGTVKTGKYRLVVNYNNKGQRCSDTKEFEVFGKYYGLVIDETDKIEFKHNYTEEKIIFAKGYFISSPEIVIPSITRIVNGGINEELVHDEVNKQFTNVLGNVVFKYDILIDESYYNEKDTLSYQFYLSNVGDVTEIGDYELSFSYQENGNDLSVSKTLLTVGEDEYVFDVKNEYPRVTNDEMTLSMDIETKYIDNDNLDDFDYIVYYYDKNQSKYIDVSSTTSNNRMFIITDTWDNTSTPNFKGKVTLTINQNRVDMDGYYYLEVKFKSITKEFSVSKLRDLFTWNVDTFNIVGIYHEETTDESGNIINTEFKTDKFYNNLEDTSLNIILNSVHENNINWTINKDCLEESCDPTSGTNYNNRFTAINTTGTDKKLVLKLKEGLTEEEKLEPGVYALTLYYSITDYKVLELTVYDEFVDIEFGEALIYSDISNDKVIDGLFRNKNGHIYIPVKVRGVNYRDVQVNITDANGENDYSSYFTYDRDKFENNHVLDISYSKDSNLEPNKYLITVLYNTKFNLIKDELNIELNSTYYNFSINNPTYSPDPLIPNAENGGVAIFKIDTEDIPNISIGTNNIDSLSNKHVFAKNTIIKNVDNNDVTNHFTITSTNIDGLGTSFNLNVSYAKNEIEPGYYQLTTHYDLDGYIIEKTSSFVVLDYVKDLTIKNVQIITGTNDGKIHKNINGTYRINYMSEYDLSNGIINAIVKNSNGVDVTNHFTIEVYDDYIDVKYKALEPFLESGKYKIEVSYKDLESNQTSTKIVDVVMYATYKEINISNINASSSIIYSDIDNQYFTFDVDTSTLSNTDINSLKLRIYNSKDELVYSDITSDNIINKFESLNNLLETDANYRINILPFKAPVDTYSVRLYLEDEDGEYNYSNTLSLKINTNYYKITLSSDSTIEQLINYNPSDINSIYDKDGAKGYYKFTSTYPKTDHSQYTIQIIKDNKIIKELDGNVKKINEDGINFLVSSFETGSLEIGTYNIAICLNGLVYTYKTIDVIKYIPVTKVTMLIDGKEIGNTHSMYLGQTKSVTYKFEPLNATHTNFVFESSDENVATFKNSNIIIMGKGSATITLKNSDIEVKTILTIDERITSDAYLIDYDEHIIYVNKMSTTKMEKETFIKNINGLIDNYKILNAANNDITSNTQVIGTSYSIVNGDESYKVVIIGEINGDGTINVFDNSMLFQHVRGKNRITDKYKLKAADIRKKNNINIFDVSKLFQFIRKKINSI